MPEIPDGMDETPLHPQTVEGKIREMRDIGVSLLESTDSLGETLKLVEDHLRWIADQRGDVTVDGTTQWLADLTKHVFRLSTLCQLQTDTITQLYGELRGPGY
jgi:hypothetical protein